MSGESTWIRFDLDLDPETVRVEGMAGSWEDLDGFSRTYLVAFEEWARQMRLPSQKRLDFLFKMNRIFARVARDVTLRELAAGTAEASEGSP